jgi:hypothetical protein
VFFIIETIRPKNAKMRGRGTMLTKARTNDSVYGHWLIVLSEKGGEHMLRELGTVLVCDEKLDRICKGTGLHFTDPINSVTHYRYRGLLIVTLVRDLRESEGCMTMTLKSQQDALHVMIDGKGNLMDASGRSMSADMRHRLRDCGPAFWVPETILDEDDVTYCNWCRVKTVYVRLAEVCPQCEQNFTIRDY